ncbi:hypothetical protein E1301_Tti022258 [Triplophysa tibetana]|uniref:Uncharacterized protein n=1 Tax=Triplophysa tibetana TaxID=1572043 RepID=A0A5A9NQZ3_9TELE|nr:hypothetical protein E1301_Tti022258 [Triplophysa tibetana]
MSGVNLKTTSENCSGIPLPKSLTNLSKTDTKPPSSSDPSGGRTTTSRSPSSVSRGSQLRNQSSRGAQDTSGGINWTPRSANSSPHVPKREVHRFKSTSELRRGSSPQTDLTDLDRHSNNNWRRHHFRSLDDEVTESSATGRVKEKHHRSSNGNIIWETSTGDQMSLQKQRTRGAPDREMMASRSRVCVSNTQPTAHGSPRMAAVAPFRFRVQVGEDGSSLEDLSEGSSDSMEVSSDGLCLVFVNMLFLNGFVRLVGE